MKFALPLVAMTLGVSMCTSAMAEQTNSADRQSTYSQTSIEGRPAHSYNFNFNRLVDARIKRLIESDQQLKELNDVPSNNFLIGYMFGVLTMVALAVLVALGVSIATSK